MALAIEQALKCTSVTTAYNVGAVIVINPEDPDTPFYTGFSRELPGNTHAEQCSIMKCNTAVSASTVLYTTMEPCNERLSGNVIAI